jgi:hypothetical protein
MIDINNKWKKSECEKKEWIRQEKTNVVWSEEKNKNGSNQFDGDRHEHIRS